MGKNIARKYFAFLLVIVMLITMTPLNAYAGVVIGVDANSSSPNYEAFSRYVLASDSDDPTKCFTKVYVSGNIPSGSTLKVVGYRYEYYKNPIDSLPPNIYQEYRPFVYTLSSAGEINNLEIDLYSSNCYAVCVGLWTSTDLVGTAYAYFDKAVNNAGSEMVFDPYSPGDSSSGGDIGISDPVDPPPIDPPPSGDDELDKNGDGTVDDKDIVKDIDETNTGLDNVNNKLDEIKNHSKDISDKMTNIKNSLDNLKTVVDGVKASVDQIGNKLNTTNSSLGNIHTKLEDVFDEIEKSNNHLNDIKSGISNIKDYITIPRTTDLNINIDPEPIFDPTPPTISEPHQDPYTYDRPSPTMPEFIGSPGPLPINPDPESYIMPHDDPASIDPPSVLDQPIIKDAPLTRDPVSMDNPLTIDPVNRDAPLGRDPVIMDNPLNIDPVIRDNPMERDEPISRDSPLSMDSPLGREEPYERDAPIVPDQPLN